MSIYNTLQKTGLPCAYSHFRTKQDPPFIVYLGAGQDVLRADDTHYWRQNTYQVEYYFTQKDETAEAAIESILLADGYQFTKSEDTFIDTENVFVIYYMTN